MKLVNGILRPGEILEVLENGKIKASAPGLFTEEDKDLNPPIMPFWELMGGHANTFSTPIVGDEIWLLNLIDNPLQLYWFRKDDHIANNKEIFEETGTANVEILCNRETGVGYASLFFSDGTGWMLRNDDSRLQIFPDGHIELGMNWPHRTVTIDSESIRLGDGAHPACYGDETAVILLKICGLLQNAAIAAKTTPYTMALSPIFDCAKTIQEEIPGIKSTHVKID
jgi:hypothetical protein